MSEYKPGDVALVEAGCWANRKVGLRLAEGWAHVNGVNRDGDGVVSPVRPLAVIDPEDREQVERFAGLLHNYDAHLADDPHRESAWESLTAAALREFANPTPPKPDEPMGLGAVVRVQSRHGKDYGFKLLIRGHATHQPWMGDGLKQDWVEIEGPIEVLSPGYMPKEES